MMETPASQPALLFMPDISGFTQFVKDSDIQHSQLIITELLEILIESNQLGLKVSEIEGDAIFFYKLGQIPGPEEIAEQCKKMFIAFHEQLRKYETSRICDCGACTAASRLTLKIVAHQGNISFYKVRDHEKLFGPDVILIHRLLKNEIPEHEYLLTTEEIGMEHLSTEGNSKYDWLRLMKGSTTYDLGEVRYIYSLLHPLHHLIQDPPKPETKLYRVKNPLTFETEINAPMAEVYDALIDIPHRINYLVGIKELRVEDEKHNRINRIGTQHVCVRDDSESLLTTSDVYREEGMVSFSETSTTEPVSVDYILHKNGDATKFTMIVHVQVNAIQRTLFNLLKKKKFSDEMELNLEKLKSYCEGKHRTQNDDLRIGSLVSSQ